MTDWPWRSPEATRRALTDRIKDRFAQEERAARLREISYRRFLARLFHAQPDRWVVKGGAALLLRLDPNRTSNDIDLTYVSDAGEHAVAVGALEDAAAIDLGDFFAFEITGGHIVDDDHPLERAFSVQVVASVGTGEFARFHVDLAQPRNDVDRVRIETAPALTGLAEVDAIPGATTLSFEAQLADKTCAMFERHGDSQTFSSRARDLADIRMIAAQSDIEGARLHGHLRTEGQRRLAAGTLLAPLPHAFLLPEDQLADWRRRWVRATRQAPVDFDEALIGAKRFLDPVLAGQILNARWCARDQRWIGEEPSG